MIFRNIRFLAKNLPPAGKRAQHHFEKALEVSAEIGAKGYLGQALLNLGLLFKMRKKPDRANECLSQALKIFEEGEAYTDLKQSKEALASLVR